MKLTFELAKKLYSSEDEELKEFALLNYPELKERKYPRFEDIDIVGYYIAAGDENTPVKVDSYTNIPGGLKGNSCNIDVWPTRELAEASLALSQLTQIRDAYNKLEEATNTYVYVWKTIHDDFSTSNIQRGLFYKVLHFNTQELCEKFIINNKELLNIAKPLI